MHPSPQFHHADLADARNFIASHPFATLCRNGEDGPLIALAPLVQNGETALIGHIAKANDFFDRHSDGSIPVMVLFRGADAYVSASYYPSKRETAKVVPTWNYEAVEVRGELRFNPNPTQMTDYLSPLIAHSESPLPEPWSITDAPPDYIAKLSHAIVGFDIEITSVRFVRKLSQDKSDADRAGVIDGIETFGSAQERPIASLMRAELAQ